MVKKNRVGWAAFGLLVLFTVSGVEGQESKPIRPPAKE